MLTFAATAEAKLIRVGAAGLLNQVPVHVANDKGYFQAEGLEVQLIVMSASVANQALIGGNVEFATASGSSISAIMAGAPLRIIFTTFLRPLFFLFTNQQIADIKQLRGKTIAVPGGIGRRRP